jgi:cell division protein FtsN
MASAVPRSTPSSRKRKRGGGVQTLMGGLIGLVLGLAIAVVVAFYMNQAATPFVEKVKRPLEVPKADEVPDPNQPLLRGRSEPSEPARSPTAPADQPATAAPLPASSEPESSTNSTPATETDQTQFWLQVGAFRGQEDADAMKAKLALMGIEAQIAQAEVHGMVFYRVRVGPYAQMEVMGAARNRLAESGIEASVVRQR